MEPYAPEMAVLDRMRQLRAEGLSYQRVADALNEDGHKTRNGSPWCARTTRHHLRKSR